MKLSDQIRRAVDANDMTRYRICKETGIAEAAMSRFMAGKSGLSLRALDTLADYLGLDVVARGQTEQSRGAVRK